MRFTHTYFRSEVVRFWDMCGNKNSTLHELLIAQRALIWVYLNTDADDANIERMAIELQTANENFERRAHYFHFKSGEPE